MRSSKSNKNYNTNIFFVFVFMYSDVVGEQKSGSGRVRGRHFGVGVEVGFLTSGFFGFGYFPLGESGFRVFKFLLKYPQNS